MFHNLVLITVLGLFGLAANAQTTEFTFQGSLKDGVNPANANYDFEFRLFSVDTGGSALGTLQRLAVPVSNGTFSVKLDFGAQFPGAGRFIEIAVKPAGGGSFTTLTPRQPVSSTPYSVRSLNAANADSATNAANAVNATNATNATTATNALQLGGVAAGQYVLTTDPRMTDPRTPTAGSGNYIQNTTTPQSANLSILGNATVGSTASGIVVNAESSFNFRSGRLLALGGFAFRNLYLGTEAGLANPSSTQFNSFVGYGAGRASTGGSSNSFFGAESGGNTTQGESNTFVGSGAGSSNTTGSFNTFLGRGAGTANIGGGDNTAIGNNTGFGSGNLSNATAIGAGTVVSSSNTIALGRSNGADTIQIPGALNVTGTFTGTVANATNALNLGGVAANQFVQTTDSRLTDARNPLPNSTNYIQNNTSQQASSNFNISGNGTAGIFDAVTQFNIGGNRILSNGGTNNLFAGHRAGNVNTGSNNAFFGLDTGRFNTNGSSNSFFGSNAGFNNDDGGNNTFIGTSAGFNSFGGLANGNTFVGAGSGTANTTGRSNTMIGFEANAPFPSTLNNATAVGTRAFVTQSNSLVLGSIAGINNASADTNVGIGTTAPTERLHVVGNGLFTGDLTVSGNINVNRVFATQINAGFGSFSGLNVIGQASVGFLTFVPESGGNLSLCQNSFTNRLALCGSSIRYKQNINPFSPGLSIINRLRPVSFNWKQGGMLDMGLVAEEVAEVEPLLVTHNDKGEIEGVKYDRIGVALINAVKEQQAQIEAQQKQIDQQNDIIKKQRVDFEALKALVCSQNPSAAVCKPQN